MEIRTFEPSDLREVKEALKDAFLSASSDERFNEWEFAEAVLNSNGFLPELCLTAFEGGHVIGYNALTTAIIGEARGLALGPLGVKREYQNRGAGSRLVREAILRAKRAGYPWIVVLGGDYYSRFGFEKIPANEIVVSDNDFENEHIQILYLDNELGTVSGRMVYCDAFYDAEGKLL